jgi:hypothetical protein
MSSHINPDSGTLVIESTNTLDVSGSTVDPVGASLYNKGGTYAAGNMYIGGTLVVNGDVISLGNGGGSLTLNANISSDVIPNIDSGIQYNIGSNTNPWNVGYLQKIVILTKSATNSVSLGTRGTVYVDASTDLALSLSNGIEGERKVIVTTATPAGTVVVTPSTANGFSTVAFTTVGQSVEMIYTSAGWSILSVYGPSVA